MGASLTVCSQTLKVTKFEQTNDLSASRFEKRDINGVPCGLVKVWFPVTDARFVGNVIDYSYKNGEWWVYMTKGSKRITIKTTQYPPLIYEFKEPLLSNVTYAMTVEKVTENDQRRVAIDSTKYYWGTFNDKELFVKGLKRGDWFDTNQDYYIEDFYTYKCGRIFKIGVSFSSQTGFGIVFTVTNEDDITEYLSTSFGDIGMDKSTYSYHDGELAYADEYFGNQYVVGQCDLDNDGIDELIIAIRTGDDGFTQDGPQFGESAGIGINVFKLENGEFVRKGVLTSLTNMLPAMAKIVKNNIYVYGLRYDEKYSFTGESLVPDYSFDGRAFQRKDLE